MLFSNIIGKWGSKWEVSFDSSFLDEAKLTPMSKEFPLHSKAVCVAALSSEVLSSVAKQFIPEEDLATLQQRLLDMLGEEIKPILADINLENGTPYFVWAEGSLPNQYFLAFPTMPGSNPTKSLADAATAAGLKVKTSTKDPTIHYIAEKGKLLGNSKTGFRFWVERNGYLMISPSQFALSTVMKDEKRGISEVFPENTVAFVHLSFEKAFQFLPLMMMAFSQSTGAIPDITALKDVVGGAKMYFVDCESEIIIKGESELPLGFLLHVIAASYN